MPKQRLFLGRAWYAIHTVAGFEGMVSDSIVKRAAAFDMKDKIFNALVPKENVWEIKEGRRELLEKKVYPGYVFVDMIITDDSWYIVRNTPKVTGFVGAGVTPIPINKEEIDEILRKMEQKEPQIETDLKAGELVRINQGVFKGMEGKVAEVDRERGRVKVLMTIFNRETSVELDLFQLKKV